MFEDQNNSRPSDIPSEGCPNNPTPPPVPSSPTPGGQIPPDSPKPPASQSYMGGVPVRCPRCSNVVSARFCTFCGLDLSTVYRVSPAAPQSPYSFSAQTPPPAPSSGPSQPGQVPPPMGYGYPYPPYPTAKKTSGGKVALIVTLSCLAFAALVITALLLLGSFSSSSGLPNTLPNTSGGTFPPSQNEDYFRPEGVSLEEYKQIKTGMSYARVSQIIGGDCVSVTPGETLQGKTYYTYVWYGETNPYAAIYITFTDGAVTEISNEGLTDEQ